MLMANLKIKSSTLTLKNPYYSGIHIIKKKKRFTDELCGKNYLLNCFEQ